MIALERLRRSPIPYLATTVALWGGSFIAARFVAGVSSGSDGQSGDNGHIGSVGGFDAFAVLSGRLLIAAVAFLPLLLSGRVKRMAWRDVPLLGVVAASGYWGYLLLFHLGAEGSTAATASLIINLSPVIGTVAGVALLGEATSRLRIVGILLAVAGTVPVSLADGGGLRLSGAVVYLFAASFAAGIYLVACKPLVDRYGGITLTAWGAWASLPFSLPFAPRVIEQLPDARPAAIAAMVYLGIGSSSVAYLAWGSGLARTTASTGSAALFAVPVVAVAGAWVLLGEQPPAATLAGGAVALCGVWLATKPTEPVP